MNVLQTIGGFGAKGGGTSTCTYDLLTAIHAIDPEPRVDLLTPTVTDPSDRLMGSGETWIKTVPNDYRTPLAISRNLSKFLRDSDYDVYHSNGMWMHINHTTCAIAREKNKPYVITPHGMLYPEALARSSWKKWPLRKLWFDRDIREAACIHATCQEEMNHLRALGYRGPIALIGNPVNVPEYTGRLYASLEASDKTFLGCSRSRKLGFLGRLHPRKKVENLLYGVALAKNQNLEIIIMGSGDTEYEKFLRDEVRRLGLDHNVKFLGFINGTAKYDQLSQLDCLFVPSDMENFGMIIPEALIVGTPVMASLGTPWEALNTLHCGWWRDNSPESIAKVIDEILALTSDDRKAMGRRGRDYILRTFAADKVARRMVRLYQWMNREAEKPEFVNTDL